jgi:hypothetical protein
LPRREASLKCSIFLMFVAGFQESSKLTSENTYSTHYGE